MSLIIVQTVQLREKCCTAMLEAHPPNLQSNLAFAVTWKENDPSPRSNFSFVRLPQLWTKCFGKICGHIFLMNAPACLPKPTKPVRNDQTNTAEFSGEFF